MLGRLLDLDKLDNHALQNLLLHPRLGPMILEEKNNKMVMAWAGMFSNQSDEDKYHEAVKTILVREIFEQKTGVVWSDYENKSWVEHQQGLRFDPNQLMNGVTFTDLKDLVIGLRATNVNHLYALLGVQK